MDMQATSFIEYDFAIRIPLEMYQYTEVNGQTWPVAFKWLDADGIPMDVRIDNIRSMTALAEQKSGTVGDRYECEIEGKIVLIYYAKLTPRKWFKIVPCSELEYNSYYKLRGENWD